MWKCQNVQKFETTYRNHVPVISQEATDKIADLIKNQAEFQTATQTLTREYDILQDPDEKALNCDEYNKIMEKMRACTLEMIYEVGVYQISDYMDEFDVPGASFKVFGNSRCRKCDEVQELEPDHKYFVIFECHTDTDKRLTVVFKTPRPEDPGLFEYIPAGLRSYYIRLNT